MIVFVTGATGVLGRGVVRRLAAAGHEVRGVARGNEKAELVESLGGHPVAVDLFDAAALKEAVAGADWVLHLATSIPPASAARRTGAWDTNDRLRREATGLLVDAALAGRVPNVLAESITFGYTDNGDQWIDERHPYPADGSVLESAAVLEREVGRFTAAGGRGVVLRFGWFYGPDARGVDEVLAYARTRRVAPVFGRRGGYVSSIHTDDAAAAVVAALDAPAGIYNVVDEPVTRLEYTRAFASAFGLKRLRIVPPRVLRVVGGKSAMVLAQSQRVSNAGFRAATGWAPQHPSVIEGWPAVAAARSEGAR